MPVVPDESSLENEIFLIRSWQGLLVQGSGSESTGRLMDNVQRSPTDPVSLPQCLVMTPCQTRSVLPDPVNTMQLRAGPFPAVACDLGGSSHV